ncbi:MAG: hypothetical protein F4135_01745 [Acidimicrobiia bacterium]|nr:hypothetical protein [Acidimicrobiia bacterium]
MGSYENTQEYLAYTGVTFTLLWTETWEVWDHYGMETTSDFLLLDPEGNRLTERPVPYSEETIENLLTEMTEPVEVAG